MNKMSKKTLANVVYPGISLLEKERISDLAGM
jgi:hypothetical protein